MQTTFSIKESDETGFEIIAKVKVICATKGLSFSFVVIQALKKWLEANNEDK